MRCYLTLILNKSLRDEELFLIKDYLNADNHFFKDGDRQKIIFELNNFRSHEIEAFKQMLEAELGLIFILIETKVNDWEVIDDLIKLHNLGIINKNMIFHHEYLVQQQFLHMNNLEQMIKYLDYESFNLKLFDENFIINLYENCANIARFARQQFMHRNSVLYQIERLNKITDLDLKNIKDVYSLYIYIVIKRICSNRK